MSDVKALVSVELRITYSIEDDEIYLLSKGEMFTIGKAEAVLLIPILKQFLSPDGVL